MPDIEPPEPKAQPLLRLVIRAIESGQFHEGDPSTFLSYSEALKRLGQRAPWRLAVLRLWNNGLGALVEWTAKHHELPKIAALIVDKKTLLPGKKFRSSHGGSENDLMWTNWPQWALEEANRAIKFDWTPFLAPIVKDEGQSAEPSEARVREGDEGDTPTYQGIIVSDPPPAHIRRSRITVGDVLGWLAAGQTESEILRRHAELQREDIRASLAYAADREKRSFKPSFAERWVGKFSLPAPDPEDARLTYLLERYERNRQ